MALPCRPQAPVWCFTFDTLYSHTLLLRNVPPQARLIERWLERYVDLEVRRFLSLRCPG